MRRLLVIIALGAIVAVIGIEVATHHKGPQDYCGYFAKDDPKNCPPPSPSSSSSKKGN